MLIRTIKMQHGCDRLFLSLKTALLFCHFFPLSSRRYLQFDSPIILKKVF